MKMITLMMTMILIMLPIPVSIIFIVGQLNKKNLKSNKLQQNISDKQILKKMLTNLMITFLF